MISTENYLRISDDVHAWMSHASRYWLGVTVNSMRAMKGVGPVDLPSRGAHAHVVAAAREGVKLLKYEALGKKKGTVLLVPSLINQWYVFDLMADVSVVLHLQQQGLEVWAVDWGSPGPEGIQRGFSDYVDTFLPWALELASAGKGPIHVLGYCMGGTLTAIHAALHPEQVKTLTLLGAPIDFHASGILATWTQPPFFSGDELVDAFGNVPPLMLQSAFKTMAVTSAIKKYADLWDHAQDADAASYFLAVESWLEDNVAFPGGLYRPYISELYQKNALVQGSLKVGDRTVDLKRITMPVQVISAQRDTIVEAQSARAIMDLVSSPEKHLLEYDTGHIGLTTSRRALRDLWPQASGWMLAHK